MILAGNKIDLEDEREVTYEEGNERALAFGCPFFETSAKTRINADQIFFELVREIKKDDARYYNTPSAPKKKKKKGSRMYFIVRYSSHYVIFNKPNVYFHCIFHLTSKLKVAGLSKTCYLYQLIS